MDNITTNEQETSIPKLVSVVEFAEILGVSQFTVYKMIRDRMISVIRIGVPGSQKARVIIPMKKALEELEASYGRPARTLWRSKAV
jgi:excisionase family DNA binding protein